MTDFALERGPLELDPASGLARLTVGLPWYRSMPHGAVAIDALSIDGVQVDPAAVLRHVDGRSLDAEQVRSVEQAWFVQDAVVLQFPLETSTASATAHVEAVFALQVDYLAPGLNPRLALPVRGEVPVRSPQ